MPFLESDTLELKARWQDDSCLATVCAFANSQGGKLIVGVDDRSNPIGKLNIKKLLEDIPNKIISKCGIFPRVYEQQEIVIVEIERSEVAISYSGYFFIRTGSTTQSLKGKDLAKFLIAKSGSNWDEYTVENSTEEDLSSKKIQYFKVKAKERLPIAESDISDLALLEKLNLVANRKFKRAALLLFGTNPRRFFTNAYLRIGKFDKDGTLLSSDTIEGNLFEQVEIANELLRTKYVISKVEIKDLYRTETLEIPQEAIREVITNAVIHRDYVGDHTQIKIFPDRIVFWNAGGLPESLKITDLKETHPSKPRNDLLADIFFKAGLVETWGTGTQKIFKACEKAGLPEPLFKEEFGGLSVTIFQESLSSDVLKKMDINDRQREIIVFLKENASVSNSQYQKLFSVSKATATYELRSLVEMSILKREGKIGPGAVYRIQRLPNVEPGQILTSKMMNDLVDKVISKAKIHGLAIHSTLNFRPRTIIRANDFNLLLSYVEQIYQHLGKTLPKWSFGKFAEGQIIHSSHFNEIIRRIEEI